MITSTRLLYAQRWKNAEIPTMEEWIVKMAELGGRWQKEDGERKPLI